MKHSKIFTREDGTQYQLTAILKIDDFRADGVPNWYFMVSYRKKGKRKWLNTPYEAHNYVSQEEVQETYLELWNKLKPIR